MANESIFAEGESKTLALHGNDGTSLLSFQRTNEYVFAYVDDEFVGQIACEDFDEALKRMRSMWPSSSPPLETALKRG